MGQLQTLTRAFALAEGAHRTPGEALTLLNRHQLALGDEHLFTIVYAIIDPERHTIEWANGGHPPPLLRAADGACRFIEGANGLMGVEDKAYKTFSQPIDASSTVLLYTDGLVERRGESLDVGLDRLAAAAHAGPEEPEALRDHVLAALIEPGGQRYDDVTAVVARLMK
jgi:serine phosphatase RsbU (regulator of sigma subunit)